MESKTRAGLERSLIFAIAALFIVQQFTHWDPLSPIIGGFVFVTIALLAPRLKGMTLWLTAAFIAIGALLMFLQKADMRLWLDAAGINVTLVTLFVFAPLFGIPVRIPEYVEALKQFFDASVRSRIALFTGTQLLAQIMGVFINVGSIPVVYNLTFVKPHPGMSLPLANAMNRGFAGAIFWSPYFAAMALVTSSLSLGWTAIVPYVIGLSLLSVLVSIALDFNRIRGEETTTAAEPTTAGKDKSVAAFPLGLAVYLAGAIAVILVLERLVELPMVMIICMAAAIFPLAWCCAKRSMEAYRQGLITHVTVTLPALRKEIALFLAAGFFSGSIGITGFGASVPALLERIPLPIPLSFTILTIVLIVGTSFVGLHPIVPVTILAGGIDPADVLISPVYFAVLLLGSWGMSNTVSPASAVNNLLAGLFKRPVFEIAGQNYKFAACMAVMLFLYLFVLRI